MDIIYSYSHLGGEEILLVRHPEIHAEINHVIESIPNPGRTKESKEKTMKGRMLYSPKDINSQFKQRFNDKGWNELKNIYDIEIPEYPHKIKNAFKQCDFFKPPVLIEVQFGKYAFMFYDLAKFQYFYNINKISVGVEIVPCHFLQKQMSSGVSYGEQLVYDLERLSKNFPSVPVRIILIDMPLTSDDYFKEERKETRTVYNRTQKEIKSWLRKGKGKKK